MLDITKGYIKNKLGLKIFTEQGFVNFDGVSVKEPQIVYKITFTDNSEIVVSFNHRFFTEDGRDIYVHELSSGVTLLGINGSNKTINTIVTEDKKEYVFDIINSQTHSYISNGVVSHNCEFLSSEALLINSIVLNNIKVKELPEPDFNGFNWFRGIKEGETILIGIDPATGTGNDVSSIEIFSFPELEQIGEFRSNTTSSPELYRVFKNAIRFLNLKKTTIYFSVENNGVGEGFIALYQNDERPPEAHFISEEGKNRLGMVTTGKSKLKSCINLKELVTKGTIQIKSKMLLTELKGFVRRLGSYSAQPGLTDDSVSATLIVVRLIEEISSFEDEAYDMLYTLEEDKEAFDDHDEGVPMSLGGMEGTLGQGIAGNYFHDPRNPDSFDPFKGMGI